jgi:hypothetical protein
MQIKVEVTQEDIDDGIPTDAESCPVALALRREFDVEGVCPIIRVTHRTVSITALDGRRLEGRLPDRARRFVNLFDDDSDVEPIAFNLRLTRTD